MAKWETPTSVLPQRAIRQHLQIKIALVELENPFMKLQSIQQSKNLENNCINRVGGIVSFCLHHLIPQAVISQCQKANYQHKTFPLFGKGKAGCRIKELLQVTTHRLACLRGLEMARSKEEERGYQSSATCYGLLGSKCAALQ